MNRRRWLIGASGLAGALFAEWRAMGQMADAPRTLEYWMGLADALGRDDYFGGGPGFEVSVSQRSASQMRAIEQLPQVGVDPDLLTLLPKLARLREVSVSAAKTSKWYHGYLWPTPAATLEARKQAAAVKDEIERLRTAMAKRYGRPFPEMPAPNW